MKKYFFLKAVLGGLFYSCFLPQVIKKSILRRAALSFILCSGVTAGNVYAETVIVQGTDVLFLAGRDDVTIPALGFHDPDYPT